MNNIQWWCLEYHSKNTQIIRDECLEYHSKNTQIIRDECLEYHSKNTQIIRVMIWVFIVSF